MTINYIIFSLKERPMQVIFKKKVYCHPIFFFFNFIAYLFMAVLGLCDCERFSLIAAGKGYISSLCWGSSFWWPLLLPSTGSRAFSNFRSVGQQL